VVVTEEVSELRYYQGHVMEISVDKLIGTHDLSEANYYLYAVKECRVIAN
jgi:hypothetical protein